MFQQFLDFQDGRLLNFSNAVTQASEEDSSKKSAKKELQKLANFNQISG